MKKMEEGFSLVEVIIAVAILGLLSLPILAYFTNAAVSTSKGRDTQKATLAAESVVEQITNSGDYNTIEDELSAAPGWTLEQKADDVPDNKTLMTKVLSEDGQSYQAKVTIDYNYSRTNSEGVDTDSLYNDYETPELKALYSPNNVVIAENDQLSTAVSHFVTLNPDDTTADIKNGMSRSIKLTVMNDPDSNLPSGAQVYIVKGSYEYEYNDESYEAVLEDVKIEKEKLKNIYYMYNIYDENEATDVIVDYDSSIMTDEAKDISVFFVCQKKVLQPSGHMLNVSASGTAMQSEYYTNGISCSGITADMNLIKHNLTGKRIANITVDIYNENETTFNTDTRIVHLDTSKGER